MIDSTNDKIDSIVNGTSNVQVSYNLDVIRPGEGVGIDRRTPNRVRVFNTLQQYNISNGSLTNVFTNNILELGTFTNYFVHQNSGTQIVLIKDLQIFINDSVSSWKKGQVLRLVFEDELVPSIYDVKIYTDATNKANTGVYGVNIAVLNDLDFTPSLNKPIFEIICLDETLLKFRIDKIR
jgi:hypothetical protein